MRYIFSLALLLGSIQLSVCQVTNVEYFLDQDPGFGKATAVSITAGADISQNFIVPINTLGEGFHTLFIRAKDAAQAWSLTGSHSFVIAPAKATNLTAVEYFLDTDPGFGKGTAVPFTAGNTISTDVVIPLTNISAGYHVLHVRSKDDLGQWSLTTRYTFYVYATAGTTVTGAEYFIDNDPGIGSANALPFSSGANATIEATIPLTDVPFGFHTLSIRTRDNQGRWSVTTHKVFYVDNAPGAATITAFEYYFAVDNSVSATYTYTNTEPAAAVDLDFTANLSDLEPNKEYTMNVRAVSSNGQRSQWYSKKVKVCDGAVSNAAFGTIIMGTEISIVDSSAGATRYAWDFGDGKTDSVSNPVHRYTVGGIYNVKLVVSNYCNSDTLIKTVQALSLQSMTPNRGGNTGSITVRILGGGFTNSTLAKLVKGGEEIVAASAVALDSGRVLQATFELYNQAPAIWNLVVDNLSTTQTIPNALTIEAGQPVDIRVEVQGRSEARRGSLQDYTITISNNSNIDANGVPVYFAVPQSAVVELGFDVFAVPSNKFVNIDTTELYGEVDTLFDTYTNMKLYGFIVRNVPAGGSKSLKVKIAITSNSSIIAWSTGPWYGSPMPTDVAECLGGVVSTVLDVATFFNPGLGVARCIYNATADQFLTAFIMHPKPGEIIQTYQNGNKGIKRNVEAVASIGRDIVYPIFDWGYSVVTNCASEVLEKTAVGRGKVIKTAVIEIIKAVGPGKAKSKLKLSSVYELVSSAWNGWQTVNACKKVFDRSNINFKSILNVASFDPNEKTGPGGNSIQNYNRGLSPFHYTIYFENVDTATAPAQEVVVLDTLDKSKFDLSTFSLQSFGFGETVNKSIPGGLHFYSTNTLVQRSGKPDMLVRTDARLDTSNGILQWRFLSLDAVTRELVDDPLDGFLPPNKNGYEGQGFVSFSVLPKKTLAHGTEIRNKGIIYFDNNDPIITNEFINTIDKIAPVSKVATLPAQTTDTTFTVSWSGTDNGAGIRSYDVYYSTNNGNFLLWQYDITVTSAAFTGQKDSLYKFYCVAKDYAGNEEAGKTAGETSILVVGKVTAVGDPQGNGFYFRQNYPNPAITDTWLEFGLPVAQQVTINIRDIQGKLLGTVTNKLFTPGVHKLNYKVGNLPGGLYILEFDSKKYKRSIKLLKQ